MRNSNPYPISKKVDTDHGSTTPYSTPSEDHLMHNVHPPSVDIKKLHKSMESIRLTSSLSTREELQQHPLPPPVGKSAPALTDEETDILVKSNYDGKTLINSSRKIERKYFDPSYNNQNFALFSFLPSPGATPDQNGIYGMCKIRGTFSTIDDADERAEWLIRNVDSYHSIYTAYVGRPFPVIAGGQGEKMGTDVKTIDVAKETQETIDKSARDEEKKAIAEIKEREEKLKEDVSPDTEEDPFEHYTMLCVKRSHLMYTYEQGVAQLLHIRKVLDAADREILKMDKENEDYKKEYMARYNEARQGVDLPTVQEVMESDNPDVQRDAAYVKYMDTDVQLSQFYNLMDKNLQTLFE